MRLIDADTLVKEFEDPEPSQTTSTGVTSGWAIGLGTVRYRIRKAPTIDAEPVRHGKWIWDDEGYHCSECWYHAQGNTLECMDGTFKFCPVCGAKMLPPTQTDDGVR